MLYALPYGGDVLLIACCNVEPASGGLTVLSRGDRDPCRHWGKPDTADTAALVGKPSVFLALCRGRHCLFRFEGVGARISFANKIPGRRDRIEPDRLALPWVSAIADKLL